MTEGAALKLAAAAAGALAGAVVAWAGTSLTLVGRVTALEKQLDRVELAIRALGHPVQDPAYVAPERPVQRGAK